MCQKIKFLAELYFELFTDNEEDLAVGDYNQVSLEDIDAQTFEY